MRASGDARSKKTQQNRGIAQARITMEIFEHCICLQCGDCLEMSDRSIEEVNERCNLEEEEVFGHGRRGDPGPLALARGISFHLTYKASEEHSVVAASVCVPYCEITVHLCVNLLFFIANLEASSTISGDPQEGFERKKML